MNILIIKHGHSKGRDGREYFVNAKSLADKLNQARLEIPLDENHSYNRALGWFSSFSGDENGLYANLELNEEGKKLVSTKQYKYLSPVLELTKDKEVINIDSVALTNRPNLLGLSVNTKSENKTTGQIIEINTKNHIKELQVNEENEVQTQEPQAQEPQEPQNSKSASDIYASIKDLNKRLDSVVQMLQNAQQTTTQENAKQESELNAKIERVEKAVEMILKPLDLQANSKDDLSADELKICQALQITKEEFINTRQV